MTLERYKTAYKHVKEFLKIHYQIDDIMINRLDHEFITSYDHYLRTVRGCNNNTTIKYIKNLKKIILLALKNGWLQKDPFINYKARLTRVKREFLDADELQRIEDIEIFIPRLDAVRDFFIFSCYTGLAYIDVARLTKDNLRIGIDGEMWVFTERKKTKTSSNVPLLPKAQQLIEKYKDHPVAVNRRKLFPILSNQNMNAYLKEIADLSGVKKNLTFHMARHTFATTVTLTNDVPIESVSEMLGHKDIRTTQIYAKVIEKKVSSDMKMLRNKLIEKADLHFKKKKVKKG